MVFDSLVAASLKANSILLFGLPVVPWGLYLVVFDYHDYFEQAYVQRCHHSLDAWDAYSNLYRPEHVPASHHRS